jgi:hypothetical protein
MVDEGAQGRARTGRVGRRSLAGAEGFPICVSRSGRKNPDRQTAELNQAVVRFASENFGLKQQVDLNAWANYLAAPDIVAPSAV